MKDVFKLPPMELAFDIQVKGAETGLDWVGKFKYKRPSLGDRSRIDVMRTRLNGDLTMLDQETIDFNEAIAHLRHTLIDYPDWWKDSNMGLDLYDGNVVAEIFNRCMAYEIEWKKKGKKTLG